MAEIFILHAPENAPLVRKLADAVAREGYDVRRDEDGTTPWPTRSTRPQR